nr:hypothetical protein [uncultured Flavobacterium sp.]
MLLNKRPFYPLKYCFLLICLNVFSQTKIYKSDFQFKDFRSEKFIDSVRAANNKNLLNSSQNQTQISNTHTFTLTEKQLLVLDNNKKKILQLDLETEFPTANFAHDAYSVILDTTTENVWFCYQNFLMHYDFKNNKRLRKVDLSNWNPTQVVLENRTIWLISKNDGQVYGLDFEPDQRKAAEIEAKAKMDFERFRCDVPDQKKIEAAKAAQEKYKNKK